MSHSKSGVEVYPLGSKTHRPSKQFGTIALLAVMSGLAALGVNDRIQHGHNQNYPSISRDYSAPAKMESVVKAAQKDVIYSSDVSQTGKFQKLSVSFSKSAPFSLIDQASSVKLESSISKDGVVSSRLLGDVHKLNIPSGSVLEVVQRPDKETVAGSKGPRFNDNVNETRLENEVSLKQSGYSLALGSAEMAKSKDAPTVVSFIHSDGKIDTLSVVAGKDGSYHLKTTGEVQKSASLSKVAQNDGLLR